MSTLPAHNSWITCPRPNPRVRLRLFCIPYAGCGASVFRTWSDNFPQEVHVCPVQLHGRENRLAEPPFTRLSPLVEALAQALIPYLSMPFAFFGHSMGALISFELVRYLRKHDMAIPVHLFVSGYRAPQLPDRDPPIHNLPESEFIEELRKLNGTPEEVLQNAELVQLLLAVLRADFALCETYSYWAEPPLTCPISAFGGLADSKASRDEIAAWGHQTTGTFTMRMLPGDHFYLHRLQAPLLQLVSQKLMQAFR